VPAACRRHGKAPGIMAATVDEGRAALDTGFRAVAYGLDHWLYAQALRTGLEALRTARQER
jgi:2-keto-3-deoxy-L-rhamnonate aldolase RhmA